jgi:hypothetical protein
MKKLVFLALVALSFLATASTLSNKSEGPLPTCNPCPLVR